MENVKKLKKDYESTKIYSKKYNKNNINVQLDRNLIYLLKDKIRDKNIPLKFFIEELIRKSI